MLVENRKNKLIASSLSLLVKVGALIYNNAKLCIGGCYHKRHSMSSGRGVDLLEHGHELELGATYVTLLYNSMIK